MATWTGTRALNSLTGDLTDIGRTINSTTNTPQFGDGTTITRITHFTGEFVDKATQWLLAANADGSPVLEIGSPNFPTYIYDTYGNADWGVGGQLRPVSGYPLAVLRNTVWRVENSVDSSAFAGNFQDVNTHAEWCTFAWSRATHVPFFGRANIFRNTVFGGAGSSSGISNFGPFLGFTIDTSNVLVRDFFLGFKAEYGQPTWLRGFQWVNCGSDAHCWTTSNNTWGGTSDGAMNLQDCTTTKSKVSAGNNGWIKVWRTLTGRTADASGNGVSGAIRYALWGSSGSWTPYAETYTVNASAQASFYQTENTTISGLTAQRNELAYYFQPGERVRISGFANAALNGDFSVQGRPYAVGLAQGNFRDKTQLWVTGKNAATEATKSITFTVLPAISTSTGTYADYKVQIIDARVLDNIGDGAGYTFGGARNLTQLLAGNGAWAGAYERNLWRIVEIPPFPLLRQVQDFNIAAFPDAPGAKVEWNTLAVNDPQITVTNAATVASYTELESAQKAYDYVEWWKRQSANHAYPTLFSGICTRNNATLNFGSLNVVIDKNAAQALSVNTGTGTVTIKATEFVGGITTTGVVTLLNGAKVNGPVDDANGVRVTIRKSGGGNFNIAARYGSGSTYTDLGYQAGVSTVTYTVPKGQPVEVVMWALGYVTYSRLISTADGGVVFDAEMVLNESINTALDVSPYLPNIALSLDTSGANPVFVITFNAAMTIAGIELGKAVIHRLVGQEIALKAGFPPGSTATIVINADEITNQLPAARLALGAGLSVTDRVYLDFFINTAPALVLNPAYVINPPRADGNQVVILRAKPALDASVMALAVRQEIERTGGMLDGKASQASVTALATANQTEHDATQAAIAALPAPLTATQTRAQVDAALTAYDAVVPADLATLATSAQVTALGAPLQASSYTAPPSATSTAQAVRAELATELGRMDAAVSSRLASASYTAPTAPPTAAQNATAVRTELATELGRIDASVSSRLAASAYTAPTTPPTAAAIRNEIESAGGKLDKAMKAAQSAEDQTL